MIVYADSSFLVRIYAPHTDSRHAVRWLEKAREPLPYTLLHRHEIRTALRLRVFRREVDSIQCREAFQEIESDLADEILVHVPAPWTDAFRAAEELSSKHVPTLGVRSLDLLHVGLAIAMKSEQFLTFDARQRALANAAGLRVDF